MNIYEFKQAVFGRAIRYLLSPYDLSMKQAEARAAKEIASEYRIKAAREKKRAMPAPAPAPDDASIESELVGAKERFFAKLESFFARHDANVARERAARRAAKRAVKRYQLTKPAPTPQPELPADNVLSFPGPLVYGGAGMTSTSQHIDESMFPARYQDRTTANWRESIARNEAQRSTKS